MDFFNIIMYSIISQQNAFYLSSSQMLPPHTDLNLKIYVAFHSLEQLNVSRVFCFMILIFCLYGRYNVEVKATPAFSRQL